MRKKTVWALLLLVVIVGVIFLLTRGSKEEVMEEEDVRVEEVEEIEESEDEEGMGDTQQQEEIEYTGDTDFSAFSSEAQIIGKKSEAQFSIEGIEDVSRDGFHQFVFTLLTEEDDEPFVTAKYLANQGVIRMDFQGIEMDNSGIGYQQERRVDKDGILTIYHNISGKTDQELYDIGVSRSTIFNLTSEQLDEGKWTVLLQVKYPGAIDLDVDLGSQEFSEDDQRIEGVTADDGASISGYTYSGSSGLLKLIWNVTSIADNPIPSVSATYNEEEYLVVTFESLTTDRVAAFGDNLILPSPITAEVIREEETSTYIFTGMEEIREFKLSASLSPNQIVLEIR